MWQTNKTGPVLAHHCQPTVSNTITRRWHRNSLLKWLLVMITMMIRMTMTSRTGTEADSGDWSPVLSKCHQRLIILYVVYHGSTISQADCNHLLLRRLTTTTTTMIQLLQNNNNDTTTTKQECGLGLDVLVWRPIKASAYVSSRMDWQMPWSRT